jgi:tetratricopeptide (TPR) repeat protein/DNA-binding CsgD family transcriptional regulator
LAQDIFKRIGSVFDEARVNYGLSILEYEKGNYSKALQLLDANIVLYGSVIIDSVRLGASYQTKAQVYSRMGDYRIAMTNALKAVQILEKTNNQLRLADCYNQLAATEAYLNHFQACIDHNQKALTIYLEHNDKLFASQALNDMGNASFYLKNYDQAVDNLNRSLALSREIRSENLQATSLTNLGKTYAARKEFKLAYRELQESLRLLEKNQSSFKIVETLNELGRVSTRTGALNQAIIFFNRSVALADSLGAKNALQNAYEGRSQALEAKGDFRNALRDHQQFVTLHDSIFNATKSQQIEELRTIYDTEKKEQEIALQKKEIDLLEEKARLTQLQKSLLGSGMGSLLLILGFAIYSYRQRTKRHILEKEKLDAELTYKKKELTSHALNLARKNQTLEDLKQRAQALKEKDQGAQGYQQLIRTINADLQDDKIWENFARQFEAVHPGFNATIAQKYQEITPNELRMMALVKMNLSTKEIASLLNISIPGVKKARQRLRKKMSISTQESLETVIMDL